MVPTTPSPNGDQKGFWAFWTTTPGVITAIAGVITAIAGLITALATAGLISRPELHETPSSPPASTALPGVTAPSPPSGTSSPNQSQRSAPFRSVTYRFGFANGTYFDLDSGKATDHGGPELELTRNWDRLSYGSKNGTWAGTRVVYIKTSTASYQGCEQATDIQSGGDAYLNEVPEDESICVWTSGRRWAVLRILNPQQVAAVANNITFEVQLFTA